jgi:hypothetical protein
MTSLTFSTPNTAGSGPMPLITAPTATAATNAPSRSSDIPLFIRSDEAYYWSVPWQKDVREAMAARAAGESVVFDSEDSNDIVRWLLSVDDEGESTED